MADSNVAGVSGGTHGKGALCGEGEPHGEGAPRGEDGAHAPHAPRRVVIATNNAHKLAEIERILAPCGWEFHALGEFGDFPEPIEDADSFEGNARIKAAAAVAHTGLAALADDSGLVVDALDGRPGVYSSRYAGEDASDADNNEKLLFELADVEDAKRTARFTSTVVLLFPDGRELVACGTCEGRIAFAARGENGFGYDPLFISDDLGGLTTAQAAPAQKDAISHRGRALQALLEQVRAQHLGVEGE